MYIPLGIKTDYSLLSSLNKMSDIFKFAQENNLKTLGILDDNLYGVMEFYDNCQTNNIKPIIGLAVNINNQKIFLYAKNYLGYQNLLKLNTIISKKTLVLADLEKYNNDLRVVVPFYSLPIYDELKNIYNDLYLGYRSDYEKANSLLITKRVVLINEILALKKDDVKYLEYLYKIKDSEFKTDNYNYYLEDTLIEDEAILEEFCRDINIVIPKNKRYMPVFSKEKDSWAFLETLCQKGLFKRLNGHILSNYQKRLNYELSVIKKMGYVDYFLIVYDYVRYAKQHNILVGPGRGSAAGSLVSYCLGITNIDPIKYNLLFERFLNPERVTMPDIDVDFEDTKREEVINYVKEKYGEEFVAPIMTFGTLASKQVLKDISKVLQINNNLIDNLVSKIDSKLTLKANLENKSILELVRNSKDLGKCYKIALKLEGLKRHISTHASGVVISKVPLDDIIPVLYNGNVLNTGLTMNYLEELGLLKMDFLAISNLTIMHNILNLVGGNLDLNKIPLDDPKIYEMFSNADTDGIFQYESLGMKSFLRKFRPSSFSDLTSVIALYRPGPMNNIDNFIARKENKQEINYFDNRLEDILKETYGIIVYQEQVSATRFALR